MNLGLPRLAVATLISATLLLGSAATATAGTWSHTDATGDVQSMSTSASDPGRAFSPDPTNTNADITRIKVAHNRGAVAITLTAAAALPRDDWAVSYLFRTPTSRFRFVNHQHFGTSHTDMFDVAGRHPGPVRCQGIRFSVDRAARQVRGVIPRRCLDSPRWVRVGATLMTLDGSPATSNDETLHGDDANGTGAPGEAHLSPKIYAPRG